MSKRETAVPPPPPSPELLSALRTRLGARGFVDDRDAMAPWLTDWRGVYHGDAAAILAPTDAAEVADVVAMTAAAGVALVPQGGNSGMCGGATPSPDGTQLILSLRRMDRIRRIDRAARLVEVEAGVILSNLHDAVEREGLRFPLTLGGKGSATVGGLISTNAGGTQVLRHGTMRALVAGIEAVWPDGTRLDALAPLKKDNRGYDPRHLLVGAEGTLGIVTAATLTLVPAIVARCVAWIGVDSPDTALHLLRLLDDRLGSALEGFELIPEPCVATVLRHIPGTRRPLGTATPWHVLVEAVADQGSADDAAAALGRRVTDALGDALARGMITDAAIGKNEREADAMWRLRDTISEAERTEGPALQHDVSVAVDRMPAFIAASRDAIAAEFGAETRSFGHLGDGNVHHHVRPPAGVDAAAWVRDIGPAVARHVYTMVQDMGGSLSAEHGIGQSKRAILGEIGDPARIAMLRGVKAGMDPDDRMNPGKLIP